MIVEQIVKYLMLVLLYSIIPYLIISIYKKDLPILTKYWQYNYKGQRAIYLSLFLLLIFGTFIYKEILHSNPIIFLASFVIGFPIAFIIHSNLSKNSQATVVPDKIKPKEIKASNLILWGIVGLFVGFISGGLISSGLGAIFSLSPQAIRVIFVFVFLFAVALTAWRGSRTTWV